MKPHLRPLVTLLRDYFSEGKAKNSFAGLWPNVWKTGIHLKKIYIYIYTYLEHGKLSFGFGLQFVFNFICSGWFIGSLIQIHLSKCCGSLVIFSQVIVLKFQLYSSNGRTTKPVVLVIEFLKLNLGFRIVGSILSTLVQIASAVGENEHANKWRDEQT